MTLVFELEISKLYRLKNNLYMPTTRSQQRYMNIHNQLSLYVSNLPKQNKTKYASNFQRQAKSSTSD